MKRLNGIGFVWSVSDAFFEKNFLLLIAFKEQHGHWRVPCSHASGTWVNRIRSSKKQCKLEEERVKQLNKIVNKIIN